MITRVHINRQRLQANRKLPKAERLPVITAKTYKDNRYGFAAEIPGPCKIVYSPDKPLSCGAILWIEATGEVKIK